MDVEVTTHNNRTAVRHQYITEIRQIVEVQQCKNYTAKVLVQYTAAFPCRELSTRQVKNLSLRTKTAKTIDSTTVRVTHAEALHYIDHHLSDNHLT